MDKIRYEAMVRRMTALEARVAVLEKRLSEPDATGGVAELRRKYPIFMSKSKAADVLGVTRTTVYTMIVDGRLDENAMGKVTTSSVIDLMIKRAETTTRKPRGKYAKA